MYQRQKTSRNIYERDDTQCDNSIHLVDKQQCTWLHGVEQSNLHCLFQHLVCREKYS